MSFEIFFIVATWTDEPHLRNCNLEWTGGTRDETLSDGSNCLHSLTAVVLVARYKCVTLLMRHDVKL